MKNKKVSKKPKNSKLMMVIDEVRRVYFIVNSYRKKNTIFRHIGQYEGITTEALKEADSLSFVRNETKDLDKVKRFISVLDSETYEKIKIKDIERVYGGLI